MSFRRLLNARFSKVILICWILFSYFPGFIFSAVVTLSSIEIFRTHDWLEATPTVYFLCKGKNENKIVLPDVKKPHVSYTFRSEESWQPLTNFTSTKCKRCGLYEEHSIMSDGVFDEWEFCPSDSAKSDGRYIRSKEKEFNATFLCPECLSFVTASASASERKDDGKGMHIAVLVLLIALISTLLILGVVGGYKYGQKKNRKKDQARFLKVI